MPRNRPDPIEDRLDRLYDEPPERFTAARDALAKELRADGSTDAAERVRRLRRPTVAAWALNQVARRHADDVRGLTELGDELRRAQRRALSGVASDDLRRLGAERRRLVEQLSRRADEVLADAGRGRSPALQQAVVNTLEAAALSADDGRALLEGRLERDLTPESGFGTIDGFSIVPPPPARESRRSRSSRPARDTAGARTRTRDARKEREREQALDAARERLAEAERAARQRRDDEARALQTHDRASADEAETATRVRELERRLRDARTELDRHREASRAARRELDQARRAAARSAHELDVAHTILDRLEAGTGDGS